MKGTNGNFRFSVLNVIVTVTVPPTVTFAAAGDAVVHRDVSGVVGWSRSSWT